MPPGLLMFHSWRSQSLFMSWSHLLTRRRINLPFSQSEGKPRVFIVRLCVVEGSRVERRRGRQMEV